MFSAVTWKDQLNATGHLEPVACLFDIWGELFPKSKSMTADDYVFMMQFYSLLENVFRNAILLPYVPAYRTINKDCGRYPSSTEHNDKRLPFTALQFESTGPNLLTYLETNRERTILYALTCSILHGYCLTRLGQFSESHRTSTV